MGCIDNEKGWIAVFWGSILLGILALIFGTSSIEDDLASRAKFMLEEGGHEWAQIEASGRNLVLTGEAPDAAAKENAISTANGVYGVSCVADMTELKVADAAMETPAASAPAKQAPATEAPDGGKSAPGSGEPAKQGKAADTASPVSDTKESQAPVAPAVPEKTPEDAATAPPPAAAPPPDKKAGQAPAAVTTPPYQAPQGYYRPQAPAWGVPQRRVAPQWTIEQRRKYWDNIRKNQQRNMMRYQRRNPNCRYGWPNC